LAAVADLPARLGVERRAVEHDDRLLTLAHAVDALAVNVQREDPRAGDRQVLVALEARRLAVVLERVAGPEAPGRARLLALALHRRLEALLVDAHAALAADVGGQVQRKAVGVVEPERG